MAPLIVFVGLIIVGLVWLIYYRAKMGRENEEIARMREMENERGRNEEADRLTDSQEN